MIDKKESHNNDDDETEELERITHNLQDDLTELDGVEKVDLVTKGEQAPEGSKAGGEVAVLDFRYVGCK